MRAWSPTARTAGRRSTIDLGAVNSLLSRLFRAGFYYKTFMWPPSLLDDLRAGSSAAWPASAWRRSRPIPTATTRLHAHCDVLVIGGGPAGLSAALAAGRSGARHPGATSSRSSAARCSARRAIASMASPADHGSPTRWPSWRAMPDVTPAAAHHRLRLLRPQLCQRWWSGSAIT